MEAVVKGSADVPRSVKPVVPSLAEGTMSARSARLQPSTLSFPSASSAGAFSMMPIPSTRRLEADRTLGFRPSAEHRSNQDRVRQCVSHGVAEHDLGHVIGQLASSHPDRRGHPPRTGTGPSGPQGVASLEEDQTKAPVVDDPVVLRGSRVSGNRRTASAVVRPVAVGRGVFPFRTTMDLGIPPPAAGPRNAGRKREFGSADFPAGGSGSAMKRGTRMPPHLGACAAEIDLLRKR